MAKLKVYLSRDGQRRYGVLSGGETKDYDIPNPGYYESEAYAEEYSQTFYANGELDREYDRDWVQDYEYARSFAQIRVAADVTGIGEYAFAFFENANVSFEEPASIGHLGYWAFACTGISGRVALPGLQDSVLAEAFSGCSKLEEVDLSGSGVVDIGDKAFMRCHNLKRITGCANVRSVGERAFTRCAALKYVGFSPTQLQSVGATAFHITSVGARLDGFGKTSFAPYARRRDRFTEQALAEIRAVELPDAGGVPAYVDEQSYPDLPYARDTSGKQRDMTDGCMMFSVYHATHGRFGGVQYADFAAWWAKVCEAYAEGNDNARLTDTVLDFGKYDMTMLHEVADLLGMQLKDFSDCDLRYGENNEALMTRDATAKREIRQALMMGHPVIASISTGKMQTAEGVLPFASSHDVAIVGSRNGKLIVVDSANIDGERGGVYEVAYEDLFLGGMPDANGEPMDYNAICVLVPKGVSA